MRERNELFWGALLSEPNISDKALGELATDANMPFEKKDLDWCRRNLHRAPRRIEAETSMSRVKDTEPWDQKVARIDKAFKLYAKVASMNHVKGLVVHGPPGIGKSWTLEQILGEALWLRGAASAVGLFECLYWGRKSAVVLDDCDSVLDHVEALNLLKSVLDTTGSRVVRWAKQNKQLKETLGLDELEFKFEGRVVFCTNKNLQASAKSGTKASKDLAAVLDRCDYIDLGVHTREDLLARMETVVGPGLTMDFIREHIDRWNSLSLRLAVRIDELRESEPEDWKDIALALRGKS